MAHPIAVSAPRPRTAAWAAFISFLGLAIAIGARGASAPPLHPDGLARLAAVFGVTMHAALVPVVATMPAPRWARRAGYAWIVVDIVANTMTLGGATEPVTTAIRLSGHLFAAAWIWSASQEWTGVRRAIGLALATWLAGYTVVAPVVPDAAFTPAVPLMLVWLGVVATARAGEPTPGTLRAGRSRALRATAPQ
jgi:hypothetical protein